MREFDKNFFSTNAGKINGIVLDLLLATNIVPVLLVLFSIADIFAVSYVKVFSLFAFSIAFSTFDYYVVKILNNQKMAIYTGLCFLELFITMAGTHAHIGMYISYSFVVFLSSFYYNKKLVNRVSVISFVLTMLSLYFKFQKGASIFLNTEGKEYTFINCYIPIAVGFTIEFIFVYFIALANTKRNYKFFSDLTAAVDTRNEILNHLNDANKKLDAKNLELEVTQFNIIQFVSECLGSHDLFTGRHVLHTKEYVALIAKQLQQTGHYTETLTDDTISLYSSAAFLHDIGKLHIPEGILNKVGKFTDEEFERMKSHPEEGRKLLEFLPKISDGRFNDIAIQMAYCHHEKWDGNGYPRKISGEEIPLCARIMAAADVLDALISQRLYKDPMSIDEAMEVFKNSSGTHFEPCIADAVIECKETIRKIDAAFKEQEEAKYNEELKWWYSYHNTQKNV